MTTNEEDYNIAKESGIYYVLGTEDNWQKEVATITSGRMTKSVVYISDCNIPSAKAFALASYNASVAFTGVYYKNNAISFAQAIKKWRYLERRQQFLQNQHCVAGCCKNAF